MEYKNADLEIKNIKDDGTFEGHASVFDVIDDGNDVVQIGAFTKSLKTNKTPKMLWQHNTDDVIGVWDIVQEDNKGLYVKGRIIQEVTKGKEALALMRANAIDSMSIGYITHDSDNVKGIRQLKELELMEISIVTFPMLKDAEITAVKSIETIRDFEKYLRDSGYSRRQATAIALHGYKVAMQRDSVIKEDQDYLVNSLKKLQETINVRAKPKRNKEGD